MTENRKVEEIKEMIRHLDITQRKDIVMFIHYLDYREIKGATK